MPNNMILNFAIFCSFLLIFLSVGTSGLEPGGAYSLCSPKRAATLGGSKGSVDAVDNGDAVTIANIGRQFTVPAGFHVGDLVVFQQVAVQTVVQGAVCFRLFSLQRTTLRPLQP